MPTAERRRRELAERTHILTGRQDLFVDAYIRMGDSAQAAIAAGYRRQDASITARRLLAKPHVYRVYLDRKARFVNEVIVTAADVLRELSYLAFHDPTSIYGANGDLLPIAQWPTRTRQAVSQMEIVLKNAEAGDGHIDRVLKVRFEPKSKPLELLARHLAMLIDRREIGGPGAFAGLSDADLATRISTAAAKLAQLARPVLDVQGTHTDTHTDASTDETRPESG